MEGMNIKWAKQPGFTIVELLIVIVIIGILAAITIVAYNGIQNRANDAAVQTDLRNFGNKVQTFTAINGRLPTTPELDTLGLKISTGSYGYNYTPTGSNGYNFIYCARNSDSAFVFVAASKSGNVFVYRDGAAKAGVGPLVTNATTCPNNGITSMNWGDWLFSNGVWTGHYS